MTSVIFSSGRAGLGGADPLGVVGLEPACKSAIGTPGIVGSFSDCSMMGDVMSAFDIFATLFVLFRLNKPRIFFSSGLPPLLGFLRWPLVISWILPPLGDLRLRSDCAGILTWRDGGARDD